MSKIDFNKLKNFEKLSRERGFTPLDNSVDLEGTNGEILKKYELYSCDDNKGLLLSFSSCGDNESIFLELFSSEYVLLDSCYYCLDSYVINNRIFDDDSWFSSICEDDNIWAFYHIPKIDNNNELGNEIRFEFKNNCHYICPPDRNNDSVKNDIFNFRLSFENGLGAFLKLEILKVDGKVILKKHTNKWSSELISFDALDESGLLTTDEIKLMIYKLSSNYSKEWYTERCIWGLKLFIGSIYASRRKVNIHDTLYSYLFYKDHTPLEILRYVTKHRDELLNPSRDSSLELGKIIDMSGVSKVNFANKELHREPVHNRCVRAYSETTRQYDEEGTGRSRSRYRDNRP